MVQHLGTPWLRADVSLSPNPSSIMGISRRSHYEPNRSGKNNGHRDSCNAESSNTFGLETRKKRPKKNESNEGSASKQKEGGCERGYTKEKEIRESPVWNQARKFYENVNIERKGIRRRSLCNGKFSLKNYRTATKVERPLKEDSPRSSKTMKMKPTRGG
uniref:Uncharacterized protein n=1 Tax=Megaselia scalaris TaxID=36166 RepID=T1H1K6_MEGSC